MEIKNAKQALERIEPKYRSEFLKLISGELHEKNISKDFETYLDTNKQAQEAAEWCTDNSKMARLLFSYYENKRRK